jgi:hypothetical protein
MVACTAIYAQNYDAIKVTKIDHKFTIGFERNVYSLYTPRPVSFSNKTERAQQKCNRIIFRMRLTTRFRLETGLSFKAIDRILNTRYDKHFNPNQPCKLSVPLTVQYQLGNEHKRLRPYFGGGVQYTQMVSSNGNTVSKDGEMYNNSSINSLRYMNIIFTQGIIYDINPNLQITQSIHIIPDNGIKPIGINFGVGYRIK